MSNLFHEMMEESSEKDKKIADLEAKLTLYDEVIKEREDDLETLFLIRDNLEQKIAEKDLRIEELESQFAYECECNKQFVECQNENEKLKQQLSEKDEQIKRRVAVYEKQFIEQTDENYKLKQQLAEKEEQIKELTECNQYLQIYRNRDKILFCVEQLEKVKDLLLEKCGETQSKSYCGIDEDIEEIIDDQIEELKKEL